MSVSGVSECAYFPYFPHGSSLAGRCRFLVFQNVRISRTFPMEAVWLVDVGFWCFRMCVFPVLSPWKQFGWSMSVSGVSESAYFPYFPHGSSLAGRCRFLVSQNRRISCTFPMEAVWLVDVGFWCLRIGVFPVLSPWKQFGWSMSVSGVSE